MVRVYESVSSASFAFDSAPHIAMAANGKRAPSDHDEPSPAAATASFAQFWPSSHEPGTSSHEPAATAAAALSQQPAATSALALSHEPPATDASVSSLWRPFDPEIDCVWTIAGVCRTTWEIEIEILVCARWERLVCQAMRRSQGTGRSRLH